MADAVHPVNRPGNLAATIALLFGILALLGGVTSIPAIAAGVVGLTRAASRGGAGRRVALAGMVLGIFGLVIVAPMTVLLGLTLAAWQDVRYAAGNKTIQKNLSQISIGLQVYHNANGNFPTAYLEPPNGGTPLPNPADRLSWRVGILPFLGFQAQYNSLVPTQPWNSPANRTLTDAILPMFGDPDHPSTLTRYRVFLGKESAFDPTGKKLAWGNFTDGVSNTILVAESADQVPWAQFNEMPFDRKAPPPPLGRPGAGGANVLMADGSVRFLKATVSPAVVTALITPNGGEVVPTNWDN